MTHNYLISGMTCNNCLVQVKSALLKIPEVLAADVSLNPGKATIQMSEHISLNTLQQAISPGLKYIISEYNNGDPQPALKGSVPAWFETYKPLMLIFFYLTIVSLVTARNDGAFEPSAFMEHFMAGFFITFSFFKMLDLHGFAQGYHTYDLLAKKWFGYGYIYPFIELFFGLVLLAESQQLTVYYLIFAIMGFSTLGVLQSILKRQKIQCACLGTIFKIPLGRVTLFEDVLMVAMAGTMIMIMQ